MEPQDPACAEASTLEVETQDLAKALDLVALAADRGAYPIQEFRDVGCVWERLNHVLEGHRSPRKRLPKGSVVGG